MFKIIVIALYTVAAAALCVPVLLWLSALSGSTYVWFLLPAMLLAVFSLPISYLLPDGRLKTFAHRLGEIMLGICLYLAVGIAFALIACAILGAEHIVPIGFACLCLSAVMYVSGAVNAFFIRTRHQQFKSDKLKSPFRAVLISDLHLGFSSDRHMAKRMADAVKAANASVLFIAGDIFDMRMGEYKYKEEFRKEFSSLNIPIIACEGNHDLFETDEARDEFLKECGITLLRDEKASVCGVTVIGRRDYNTKHRLAASELPINGFSVVLDHHPNEIDSLKSAGASAVLCGHTHAGQTFPGNLLLRFMNKYSYGRYGDGAFFAYVTSGAGFWGPPLRLGVSNEAVVIDFLNTQK